MLYAYNLWLQLSEASAALRLAKKRGKRATALKETQSKRKRRKQKLLLEDIELLPEDVAFDIKDNTTLLGKGKCPLVPCWWDPSSPRNADKLTNLIPTTGAFGLVCRGTYRGQPVGHLFCCCACFSRVVTPPPLQVAIKLLLKRNETNFAHVKEEALLMKKLHHPNIVHLVVSPNFSFAPSFPPSFPHLFPPTPTSP